eukprot:1157834-Pelagomonas_calceolata.AAC.9
MDSLTALSKSCGSSCTCEQQANHWAIYAHLHTTATAWHDALAPVTRQSFGTNRGANCCREHPCGGWTCTHSAHTQHTFGWVSKGSATHATTYS